MGEFGDVTSSFLGSRLSWILWVNDQYDFLFQGARDD